MKCLECNKEITDGAKFLILHDEVVIIKNVFIKIKKTGVFK